MLVLLVILICTLYLIQISPFIIPEGIAWIFVEVSIILPIVNTIYALIFKKKIKSNEEILEKWNRNILISKLVLIPFFIFNFVAWFLATLIGIVPMFMFILFTAPIVGIVYTYWIFLSTTAYSVIVIREHYKSGYMSRFMYLVLAISQFIFVCDVVGFIVLQMVIKNKKIVQIKK